jgi:hypothetical protein
MSGISFSGLVTAPGAAASITNVAPVVNVKDAPYNAKGDDSTDDFAAISAAVAACPAGGVVYFPAGKYIVTNTIVIPANITLRGSYGTRWPQYGGIPVYIKPKFGSFQGTSLLAATEVSGWRIENLTLTSGRATQITTGAAVHGISALGACKAVRFHNVMVNNFSGHGVFTDSTVNGWSGGWEVDGLNVMNCALDGWRSDNSAAKSFAFSDAVIARSECGANSGNGWYWAGLGATDFYGLRSTWNTGGYGFAVVGGVSNVSFTECQTDRSKKDGFYLNAPEALSANAPSPHVIMLTSCTASRDGKNANGGQGGYAGIRIVGTDAANPSVPVVVTGFQTHVSKDDDGAGQLSPDYGIYATKASKVVITSGVLNATVATTYDDSEAIVDAGTTTHNLVNFSTGVITRDIQTVGPSTLLASDLGYKAINYDPILATGSTAPSAGVEYLARLTLRQTRTVSKVAIGVVSTTSMALTAGQNFLAISDSNGNIVARTADITASVVSGELVLSLVTPVTLTPGIYWGVILMNGTTLPSLARASGQINGQGQSQVPSAKARFGSFGTAQTALTTIVPASIAKITTQSYWFAFI